MIKRILYIICALVLVVGCRRQEEPMSTKPHSGVAIGLGVDAVGDVIISAGAPSKSGVIADVTGFGEDTMAVYGLNNRSGEMSWAKADRIIDTLGAKVNRAGQVVFSKEYKYYPSDGLLNVYALYPSGGGTVTINDPIGATTAPNASVVLKQKATEQFDVMTGKGEGFSVAQAQRAKIKFEHALAMVRIKIYREVDAVNSIINKVEVRGVGKSNLPDITTPVFAPLLEADSVDFVSYDNPAGIEITKTSADSAVVVGAPLMLFPGLASARKIILTIDGLPYTTNIPTDWELKRGFVATLTLCIRKFEVRLESNWSISPWAAGDTVNSGLENNGKMIRVAVPMVNASGGAYGVAPVSAEVEINGKYTLKNIPIESAVDGVVKTKPFNSGILNNQAMYMTAIKFFNSSGAAMFEGRLYGGKLSTGQKVIIDTLDGGKLKVGNESGAELKLNMSFGGFGNGTATVPYEVATALHLKNIINFRGSDGSRLYNGTASGGAIFTQVEDIDLKNEAWTPIGSSSAPLFGRYNGNGYVIRNINVSSSADAGLFGYVATPSSGAGYAELSNITIVNGTVKGSVNVGGVVGNIVGRVTNCYNGASVINTATTGVYCGGVVGSLNGSSSIVSGCVNAAALSARFSVGGIVGYNNQGRIENCYNRGVVGYTGTNVNAGIGGLAGTFLRMTGVLQYSYNRAPVVVSNIASTIKGAGAVLGVGGSGACTADFRNNYYLTDVYTKGVGLNVNDMSKAIDPYEPKTDVELKGMVLIFGDKWQSDYVDEPINEGYPILKWQTKEWYSKIK